MRLPRLTPRRLPRPVPFEPTPVSEPGDLRGAGGVRREANPVTDHPLPPRVRAGEQLRTGLTAPARLRNLLTFVVESHAAFTILRDAPPINTERLIHDVVAAVDQWVLDTCRDPGLLGELAATLKDHDTDRMGCGNNHLRSCCPSETDPHHEIVSGYGHTATVAAARLADTLVGRVGATVTGDRGLGGGVSEVPEPTPRGTVPPATRWSPDDVFGSAAAYAAAREHSDRPAPYVAHEPSSAGCVWSGEPKRDTTLTCPACEPFVTATEPPVGKRGRDL